MLTSFAPSDIAIVLLGLVLFGILAFSAVGFFYAHQRSQMPIATTYFDLQGRVSALRIEQATLRTALSELNRQITEREHLSAEIASLREQLTAVQAELAALDSARREIDEVKKDAASAAAEYAEKLGELEALKADWERMTSERDRAQSETDRLERQSIERREAIEALEAERARIEAEVGPIRAERDAALRAIEEARSAQSQIASLISRRDDLTSEIDARRTEVQSLRHEVEELQVTRAELARLREDLAHVNALIQRKQAQAESLDARIEDAKRELENLRFTMIGSASGEGGLIDETALVEDLARLPACLAAPDTIRRAKRSETESVAHVDRYLKSHGLQYHERTVRAFHTSLKINDKAQMTVLAGVSGTGKSLLPRRYAEAMGIHLLQIAVEPRWDSPQDLLGFYNYIEKRYRATDLARLLVYLDPYDVSKVLSAPSDRTSHMAMVLLDEMNLARVEYYFSEFLSRLEARPTRDLVGDETRRRDSVIPMDVRGLDRQIALFPSHNVLFAGTMNDDESTLAISDKVLDRSNVMQFAAPKTFDRPLTTTPGDAPASEAQAFSQWESWVKTEAVLDPTVRDKAKRIIEGLADIMRRLNRPFGHRMHDAILAYVANYPTERPVALWENKPLVDQVELRILPKLRGVDISAADHRQAFEDLVDLLRDDLSDSPLASALEEIIETDASASGMFRWRGFTRQ